MYKTRTNVKFIPRWSWVGIILIIEWEYRERLKVRGYKGYFERIYSVLFERWKQKIYFKIWYKKLTVHLLTPSRVRNGDLGLSQCNWCKWVFRYTSFYSSWMAICSYYVLAPDAPVHKLLGFFGWHDFYNRLLVHSGDKIIGYCSAKSICNQLQTVFSSQITIQQLNNVNIFFLFLGTLTLFLV